MALNLNMTLISSMISHLSLPLTFLFLLLITKYDPKCFLRAEQINDSQWMLQKYKKKIKYKSRQKEAQKSVKIPVFVTLVCIILL